MKKKKNYIDFNIAERIEYEYNFFQLIKRKKKCRFYFTRILK